MPNLHHSIDYIEFAVTDMTEAKRFYAEAFDWSFKDYAPGYCGIRGQEKEAGGFFLAEKVERAPSGPLVVIYSEDLDATLKRVRDAGGSIAKECFAFPGGRRFHFLDPSGNELAVWTLE